MESLINFIDGKGVAPSRRAPLEAVQFLNPKNLKPLFSYLNSDFMDVVACVQAAHRAQKKWQETSWGERHFILKKFRALIEKNFDLLAYFENEDGGAPVAGSKKMVSKALAKLDACLNHQVPTLSQGESFQITSPVGLVGLMTDWQDSLSTLVENLAVSLLSANLVICFPHEASARSALKLASLLNHAGLPSGVLGILLGRGEETAIHISEHPGIKHLLFYGDNDLGEKLRKIASENNKRLTSFLGVNNTAIVFADSGLASSIEKIRELSFEFHLHGRNRVNRVLVQEKVLKEFKLEFDRQIANQKFENLAPLPTPDLKKEFQTYLEQSKKDRAKVHVAISHPSSETDSNYVALTVYDDLTNCSTLHQQNLIGPILFLQSFKYAADLPKVLNSGSYAHRAYIWTEDLVRIHKLLGQLEISQIIFNPKLQGESALVSDQLKQSGYGQNGLAGLFEFNLNRRLIEINPS